MSGLREKVYQLFILGLEGETLEKNSNIVEALKSNLGGVIFFKENIKTASQFKKLILDIKKKSNSLPFLSIDQEGGRVERTENLSENKKYLSPKFIVKKGEDALRIQTQEIAHELKDFGINLNFAPCVDVNTNPNNPIIGDRAFSDKTDEVIKFGEIAVNTYLKEGIIPCLKHFPGHGDSNLDSHLSLPKIDLALDEMERIHIKPFKTIQVPMIMVAHLHCTCFDKKEIPTSLSKNAISYLRSQIGYKGLIITDDMVMGGVLGLSPAAACIKALKAGVNILLYRHSENETIHVIEKIIKAAYEDNELQNAINKSYSKIIKIKVDLAEKSHKIKF